MELNGGFEVKATPGIVWQLISDPNNFSKFLPGVNSISVEGKKFQAMFTIDLKKYTGKFLGASYISNANIKFSGMIEEKVPKSSLLVTGEGKSIGVRFKIRILINMSPNASGTNIHWEASVDTGGFAKVFGENLVRKAAESSIREIIDNVSRSLT